MKSASVGEIKKKFARILKEIKPNEIEWPDFYHEAIELKGKPAGEIVIEGRADRF